MVTTPAKPRPRVRDREDKQRQLITAAIAEFSEHGYEKATTRAISERARCAEGLIYKYFGGKRQLLMAALAWKMDGQVDDVAPEFPTLELEIQGLLQRRIDRAWEDRDFMKVCISLASVDRELAKIMETLGRDNALHTSAYLQTLIDRGLLKPGVDLEAIASIIGGLMLSLGYFGRVIFERDRASINSQVAAVAKQLCAGLVS